MSALTRRTLLLSSAAVMVFDGRLAVAQPAAAASAAAPPDTEWRYYAADAANTRYSPLAQITADNFNDLEIAWRFKTDMLGARPEYQYEATPLLIKGRLYTTAGTRRDCVCLDAATGELLWMYRIDEGRRALNSPRQLSGHGVAYWSDGDFERILYVTIGYRLVSLDARTGLPDPNFGDNGIVDLKRDDDQQMDLDTADIGLHSTPIVSNGVVIVGAAHSAGDVPRIRNNVKGYVRGFDVRTGKRLWIFHTIPKKGEFGYDTYLHNTADDVGNSGDWGQISIDEELGLAYLGVELSTGDEVGIYRPGIDLFSDSIVAVDIKTGKRRWYYQLIHHDLWDRDVPCAAILCDIEHNGKIVKALAQPSKQAFLYVLDRETGKPIWPIPERPVPRGDVPGEWYSPTQPIPSKPPAYDRQGVSEDDLIDWTPELHAQALAIARKYRLGPIYTPPTLSKSEGPYGTLVLPGFQGGTNWPGGCYDPETSTVYVYSKTQLAVGGIVPNSNQDVSQFAYVHGVAGRQVMPQHAMGAAMPAGFHRPPPDTQAHAEGPRPGVLTVQGLSIIKPPYGRITAIDLRKGDITWQVAHGETPDFIKNHPALKGIKVPRTGQMGNVGPLCTKTLVICGDPGFSTTPVGVRGAMLRAYDKATGAEKGAVYMPAPQTGSPMTYMLGGQQYLVVAIGGGDYSAELVAFRVPQGG